MNKKVAYGLHGVSSATPVHSMLIYIFDKFHFIFLSFFSTSESVIIMILFYMRWFVFVFGGLKRSNFVEILEFLCDETEN